MITDEMIEAAGEGVMWRNHYPKEGYRYGVFADTPHHEKEPYRNDARSALTAAYPLIRAQVLEEAASVCDRRIAGDHNREDAEVKRCAQEIRNMKVQTK